MRILTEGVSSGRRRFGGGTLDPLNSEGLKNWLDDIIICTTQGRRHLVLVRQVLEKLWATDLSVNVSKIVVLLSSARVSRHCG